MCVCACWCVILRKVSATGSAPWLVWSLAWGSVSGYSLDNHSKPGCLPIAPSKRVVVNQQSSSRIGSRG